MKKSLFFLLAFFCFYRMVAQEVKQAGNLLLINGKSIPFKVIESNGINLEYRTPDPKNKLKSIDPERVFSIQYMDGTERVIFQRDTLDPLEFTIEEMRLFIKGEQDADLHYHNHVNKGAAFVVGALAAPLTIYGLLVPPLYSSIIGTWTPNVKKIKNLDQELLQKPEYREGCEKKMRDRKIRNSLIGGFVGFAAGFVGWSIIIKN